jgi:hypothetical protein
MEDIMSYNIDENPDLQKVVDKESPMKEWLVTYVGDKMNPENNEVTVELIIEAMADEFPDFIMALAEENFIRGYRQALSDVDEGERLAKEHQNQKKNEKLHS